MTYADRIHAANASCRLAHRLREEAVEDGTDADVDAGLALFVESCEARARLLRETSNLTAN